MASSVDRLGAAALGLLLASAGCSVGSGEGQVSGMVNAPGCELAEAQYELDPTFFGATAVAEQLEIRLQRGSDFEIYSDGLIILVRDAAKVRAELLGVPIPVTGDSGSPVRMTVYLNETCPADRRTLPVSYEAVSGSILFRNLYAPTLTEDDVEIAGLFTDVRFVDRERPDERFAVLSGEFEFLYTRGRPAQRFP